MGMKIKKLRERGQALVEMAIITPILIFLLIGVFEVGLTLRAYLVLANANREAARFAVRQDYLDFNSSTVGYEKVWSHTLVSIADQIDFQQRGTMIISYLSIQAYCTPPYTVTTPLDVPTYTWKYPTTSTHQTRLDYTAVGDELLTGQIKHSCEALRHGIVIYPYSVVYVEMIYEHPQLFGFPLISNPLSDPILLYTHTVFRKIQESRSAN